MPILFDSVSDNSEQFTVTLANPTAGITLGTPTSSAVTITDVPATSVTISPAPTQATEGAVITFTVARISADTAGSVSYTTINGTAITSDSGMRRSIGETKPGTQVRIAYLRGGKRSEVVLTVEEMDEQALAASIETVNIFGVLDEANMIVRHILCQNERTV